MNKYITRLFPYITIYMHDIYILLHLFLINVTKIKQVYTFSESEIMEIKQIEMIGD